MPAEHHDDVDAAAAVLDVVERQKSEVRLPLGGDPEAFVGRVGLVATALR